MDTDLIAAARDAADGAIEVAGGRVIKLDVREVHARAHGALVIGFDAIVEWGSGDVRSELVFVGNDLDTGAARAWRYPSDPVLSGLADAVNAASVAAFLNQPTIDLTVVALRPCKRAVIRARSADVDVHIKVVASASVGAIVDRHRSLAAVGLPVPELIGIDRTRGWLAWRTIPEQTLEACLNDYRFTLPSPDDLMSLIETCALADLSHAHSVPTLAAVAPQHARLITAVLPSVGPRATAIARTCAAWSFEPWPGVLHGDLHPGQVMINDEGRVVGLVDIDGAGVGDVGDDLARMLAHVMVAVELGQPETARRLDFAEQFCRLALRRLSDDDLRHRVAACLIGLSLGPWRAHEASWPQQVERLVDLADAVLNTGVEATIRSRRSP